MPDDEVPPTPRPRKSSAKRAAEPGTTGTTGTPVADVPPKPAAAPPPRAEPKPRAVKPPAAPKLQQQLEELLSAPAMLTTMLGDEYPTHIIVSRAPHVAEAWYELSKENPAVRRILTKLVEGSAIGAVVISSAAFVVPVAGYYGLLPAMDPFVALYPAYEPGGEPSTPIVPPPPSEMRNASRPARTPQDGEAAARTSMTDPVAPGQPPGVVTVAGLMQRGVHRAVNNGT